MKFKKILVAFLTCEFLLAGWIWSDENDRPKLSVILMRPIPGDDGELPLFQQIEDPAAVRKYKLQMANESATFALTLFDLALRVSKTECPFYIAIVDGGNNASQGFRLRTAGDKVVEHKLAPYMKLDPKPKGFQTTLLHESGHMIFSILSHGKGIPTQPIAPMFHTTSAITDRGTAFNEGFAEHLEATMAHFGNNRQQQDYYRHRRLTKFSESVAKTGYFFPISDMSNYAQNFARYQAVRDNRYSFENATSAKNYNRIQLSPIPNLERLRNPSQLVASEGFCASYFFWLVSDQINDLGRDEIERVYSPIFDAIQTLLNEEPVNSAGIRPYLTDFLKHYGDSDSEQRRHGLRVLYHLSHGAFFDDDYRERWKTALDANFQLDIVQLRKLYASLEKTEQAAIDRVVANIELLDRKIGNVVPILVDGCKVRLPIAFGGQELPLSFDINSVQSRILSLVPEITNEEIVAFSKERDQAPFDDFDDLTARGNLTSKSLAQIRPLDLDE